MKRPHRETASRPINDVRSVGKAFLLPLGSGTRETKHAYFGYGLNYLIDVEHAIIVDIEATPARTYDEVASTRTMLDRTEQRLNLKSDWLTADTAYGTGKLLAWLLGKGIAQATMYARIVQEDRARHQ